MIFGLNGGFAKRKRVIFRVIRGICEEKIRGFCLNGGFAKRKRDYCFNVVFAKRKRVIFAYMGDLQIENARFSG